MSKHSYSRILKSSSLIGGAQGVSMLVGMIRVKFVAMLIGPAGVGLAGTYRATTQFIGTIAGLGLKSSAVRDIAEAAGSGNDERIGRTVLTLRRMCWLTGGLGSLSVACLSKRLSLMTFNSPDYALEVALVGLTILFTNVQGGQMALIQGMRRIGDLAKLNIFGVLVGSVVSIGFYAWLGMRGIVPAFVLLGLTQLLASWWFVRKVDIPKVEMTWIESFKAAGGMVRLGVAFMWSSALTMGVAYATRVLVAREIDLVAVGIFSAAYNLSGLVVNFILNAMSADYYPSLTAVSSDHSKMRDLVNQQTEIGLLLAMPALLGTLAMAPWVIRIFYTAEFQQASDLLQWFALGCMGRVISWPLGFVMVAKGAAKLFAAAQTCFNFVHVLFIVIGLKVFGIEGVAIAFAGLYLFVIGVVWAIARRLIQFSWSRGVWMLLGVLVTMVTAGFLTVRFVPMIPATLIGLLLTAGVSVSCLRGLAQRVGSDHRICRMAYKTPLLRYIMPSEEPTP